MVVARGRRIRKRTSRGDRAIERTASPTPVSGSSASTVAAGLFFVLLGLGAAALLAAVVGADAGVRQALEPTSGGDRPSLLLAFLDGFGLLVPLLTLGIGGLFVAFGVGVARARIEPATRAHDALAWLALALAVVAPWRALRSGWIESDGGSAFSFAAALGAAAPPLLVLAPVALALLWLRRALGRRIVGTTPLSFRQSRSAWNLLIPALAVLLIVAARPLEQTFITSLTDKRFASSQVPNFVGLANYRELTALRFDTVGCRRSDAGGDGGGACRTRDDGSVRWESLGRDLLRSGWRTVAVIAAPGGAERALALSARDADWIGSIGITLSFTVVSVALELIIGLFIALTVNSSFRGRGAMRAVMLIPWAIPTVVSARLWELMLKDTSAGVINRALMVTGVLEAPQAWLSSAALQVPSAIMIDVWKTAPFMALLLLAGLQTIPAELYEAAEVDGASPWQRFLRITLPLLRPAIGVALIFRTLDALRVFDLFQVLFGRQKLTMATYNYEVLVNNQEAGYASATGVLIFLIIFAFAALFVRVLGVDAE